MVQKISRQEMIRYLTVFDISQFVEAFDCASIEHAQADRFKFFKFLTKAHEHLVHLHYIFSDRQQFGEYRSTYMDIPEQAYNRISKESAQELIQLEPRSSNLHLPSINDMKKDYISNFIKIVKGFEKKHQENLNSSRLNTLLSLVVLRDYFPNFRDIQTYCPHTLPDLHISATNSKVIRSGIVFRSASLNNYVEEELSVLFDKADINTVIDLRAADEVKTKPYNNVLTVEDDNFLRRSNNRRVRYYCVSIKPWTAKKVPQGSVKGFRFILGGAKHPKSKEILSSAPTEKWKN